MKFNKGILLVLLLSTIAPLLAMNYLSIPSSALSLENRAERDLFTAIRANNFNTVRDILDNAYNPSTLANATDEESGTTALEEAKKLGNARIINLLLEAGAAEEIGESF